MNTRSRRNLRQKVIDFYGLVCWLCLQEIDLKLGCTHPMSFTLDHVLPKRSGGENQVKNVRPAHKRCNSCRDHLFTHTVTEGFLNQFSTDVLGMDSWSAQALTQDANRQIRIKGRQRL